MRGFVRGIIMMMFCIRVVFKFFGNGRNEF